MCDRYAGRLPLMPPPTGVRMASSTSLPSWEQDAGPQRLVGMWALGERRIAPFCPAVLDALPYNYAFLSSPVIDPDFTEAVMLAFLTAIASDATLPNVIHLAALDRETPSFEAMQKQLNARGCAQLMARRR